MNRFRDRLCPARASLVLALAIVGLGPEGARAQFRPRFPTADENATSGRQNNEISRVAFAGDGGSGIPFVTQYGATDAPPSGARLQPSLLEGPALTQTLGYQGVVQPPVYAAPASGAPPAIGYGVAPYGGFAPNDPSLAPAGGKNNQRIYAMAEALWLKPNTPTDQPLVLNQNTLAPVLNVSDLPYEHELGIRASLGYALTCDYTIEGLYFGLQQWDNTAATRGGANNLSLPGALGLGTDDFFGADFMRADYTTRLHNGELNLWRRFDGTHLSGMLGFRYVNLRETFNIHSIDSDADQSDYHITAANNLYGGQLGAQYDMLIGSLELQVVGKGGVFANVAKQAQTIFDNNNAFPIRDASASSTQVAFVGEAGLIGLVKLSDNWFVRAGYTTLWLVDVARAPDQLDFSLLATSGSTLSAKQTAFLHGPSIGLQGQW